MIYRVRDGGFCISSGGSWLPGVYDSERAARYAFQFRDEDLRILQERAKGGHITTDDLRACRKLCSKGRCTAAAN